MDFNTCANAIICITKRWWSERTDFETAVRSIDEALGLCCSLTELAEDLRQAGHDMTGLDEVVKDLNEMVGERKNACGMYSM